SCDPQRGIDRAIVDILERLHMLRHNQAFLADDVVRGLEMHGRGPIRRLLALLSRPGAPGCPVEILAGEAQKAIGDEEGQTGFTFRETQALPSFMAGKNRRRAAISSRSFWISSSLALMILPSFLISEFASSSSRRRRSSSGPGRPWVFSI